jgi:CMP-N-acetylneuraminic acid synthetase
MIQNKRILSIITARGGSKEVPRKNVLNICGKPLIAWTIEATKNSKYIDRVIVTTDSEEIRNISIQYGAEVPFKRPYEISGDLAKQEDAVIHAMEFVEKQEGKKYDYIMILTPTTPLRDENELDKVIEELVNHPEARSILTMMKAQSHPLFCNTIPDNLSLANFIPDDIRLKNRQEVPTYYQPSGSTSIIEWDYFLENGSIFTPLTFAYITDSITGHDINSRIDFLLAEILLKEKILKK